MRKSKENIYYKFFSLKEKKIDETKMSLFLLIYLYIFSKLVDTMKNKRKKYYLRNNMQLFVKVDNGVKMVSKCAKIAFSSLSELIFMRLKKKKRNIMLKKK